MNTKTLRTLIPLAVLLVIGVGFALHSGVGTLSALGWGSISILCPLGALGTMLASKMLVPRAVISLVLAVAAILILGRAFCAWVCPVPVVSKLRDIFHKKADPADEPSAAKATPADESRTAKPLSAEELKVIHTDCGKADGCASCAEKRGAIDSRHVVLGGSLLTAAIFGFPVFCLICPIGLTFATVLLVMLLFTGGDVTWSIVAVPALLAAEVIFFRKWCSTFCPLSALMSLIGKANRTFRPAINDQACLETSKGVTCGVCARVCEQGIDPRHPERGADWSECTKCRACVDACPGNAITMPFLPKPADRTAPPAQNGTARRQKEAEAPILDEDLPLAASTGLDD